MAVRVFGPFGILGRLGLLLAALILAACDAGPVMRGGPGLTAGEPVQVALLVPRGSGRPLDDELATSLENAARLAAADLQGVEIDLRVYSTGNSSAQAGAAATQAVQDGAKIILGPVYAEDANAAAIAVASRGVSVLAFSNNPTIAGGNLFVLGNLFENTANRLAQYAASTGRRNVLVVHANAPAEQIGRDAVIRALGRTSATSVGSMGFEVSQQGVVQAVPAIVAEARARNADTVFLTSGTDGALPLLVQLLPENGLAPGTVQYVGLQRWDIPANARELPGLQGGWFALPDPNLTARFSERYVAAYGNPPHQIAGLAYDGIAAIGALALNGQSLGSDSLTQAAGFVGVNGVFRLRSDGTNERGLAIAQIQNSQVVVIDPAPRSFGGAGF